jgi:hypothetical protein
MDEAVDYFMMFQESFNSVFNNLKTSDHLDLLHEHELKLEKLLTIMIYGIARE